MDQPIANPILIKKSDRVVVVGATGTGKSTVAGFLLLPRKSAVIVDPKQDFRFPTSRMPRYGTVVTTTIASEVVKHEGPNPLIYRPSTSELRSGLTWFWDWIWFRENTTVYVDELFLVKKSSQDLFEGHARAIMQGRSKNISVWSATQRPARVPIIPFSESEHTFVFRLRHPADLKRMAEYTDKAVEDDPVNGHDFWYYGDRDQVLLKTNVKHVVIS